MRFLPVAVAALLVELDDLPQTLGLLASLQAEPVPGAAHAQAGRVARDEVEGAVGRLLPGGAARRDHIAVRVAGAGHKGFFGRQVVPVALDAGAADRGPEVAA